MSDFETKIAAKNIKPPTRGPIIFGFLSQKHHRGRQPEGVAAARGNPPPLCPQLPKLHPTPPCQHLRQRKWVKTRRPWLSQEPQVVSQKPQGILSHLPGPS